MPARVLETARDRAICVFVHRYNGCTVEVLHQCFWSRDANISGTYARIAKLVAAEYLTMRLFRFDQAFIGLGRRGRAIVAFLLGIPTAELPVSKAPEATIFWHHHLAICRTRVAFEQAAEQVPVFGVRDWQTDRALHQVPPFKVNDGKKDITLIPDGSFVLTYRGGEETFLLEQDMATTHSSRMRAKLRAYLLRSLQADVRYQPVLLVVPDAARQAELATWAMEEAKRLDASPAIFWLATTGQLQSSPEAPLLGAIYRIAGGPESVSIAQLAGAGAATSNTPPTGLQSVLLERASA